MRRKGCLFLFWLGLEILMGLPQRASAHDALTYAPASAENPLKGFVPYAPSTANFPHSLEWFYLPLKDLQVADDQFTWAHLDAQLAAIAARGHQAVFRIYLDYPDTEYGVPAFLAQVAKHPYTENANSVRHTSYSPNYEDPALRHALAHFIAALGKRYDGDPRIGFITVGLLGFWGEWHTYPHTAWFASTAVQNEVLDAYERAFHRTKLLMREPKPGTHAPQRAIGYHDDSFAYQTLAPPEWHFWGKISAQGVTEKWKTEVIGGELRPEVQNCLWADVPCPPFGQEFGHCVQTTHVTWLLDQGAFAGLKEPQYSRALADARKMGYELFVSQTESAFTASSSMLQGRLHVRNTGVAPFYYDWKVRIGILNTDKSLLTSWDIESKVTGILPGAPDTLWNWKHRLEGLKQGRYSLLIQVANPLPNGHPIRFANTTQDQDLSGWLTIGHFDVPKDTKP